MESYTIEDELVDYWNDYAEAYNAARRYSREFNQIVVKAVDEKKLSFRKISRIVSIHHRAISDRYYRTKAQNLGARLKG